MRASFINSIHDISATIWNQLCGIDYPFLRHEFFAALEDSKSTTRETGWQPHHLIIEEDNKTLFVMPLFIKHHSYGEYVFDWAWADAFHRHKQHYYPKLLNAIPFTPATGPRWGIDPNCDTNLILSFAFSRIEKEAIDNSYSSCHWLFIKEQALTYFSNTAYFKRTGCQYHWQNNNYENFDHFLSHFNSRKRKNLKKERKKVFDQEISITVKEADAITNLDWQHFFLFYHLTYFKRSGRQGYLTEDFFPLLASNLSEHLVMIQASRHGEVIAAALYFKDSDTLYGRYWGCKEEYDQLHFEACYYQGIEFAITHKLKRFDPGAQGEHKIQRGFTPTKTYSYHWVNQVDFHDAIERFCRQEEKEMAAYIEQANKRLPFKLPN